MKSVLFAALPALALAVPAFAQTDTAPATPSAVTAPAAAATGKKAISPDDKVCRSVNTTGSIMASRVCHSRAQWAQIDGTNEKNAAGAFTHGNHSIGTR